MGVELNLMAGFLSSVIKCIFLVMVVALALFQQKNVVFFVEGKYRI
jgi:hypothetical protein